MVEVWTCSRLGSSDSVWDPIIMWIWWWVHWRRKFWLVRVFADGFKRFRSHIVLSRRVHSSTLYSFQLAVLDRNFKLRVEVGGANDWTNLFPNTQVYVQQSFQLTWTFSFVPEDSTMNFSNFFAQLNRNFVGTLGDLENMKKYEKIVQQHQLNLFT